MDATLVKLSGGTLNLNATLTSDDGASVWNFGGASGGTIVIGRPVASFTNSVVINASAATTTLDAGSNTVAVTPHVGFTSGSLTLVKGNTATKNALVAADFTANNTALTEYTFAKSGSDITMTASSKSAAETAAAIGVSAVEAQALGSAVAATVGDASVTAAFNTALTTGGAEAQKAAKQSQPDPGALSAASSASSSSGAASFSAVGTRLASLRETRNLAYASGDASLGFAAGSGPLSEAVWLKPLISHATQELRSGIEGFDTTTRGMAFGIDTEMDEGTRVGLYGSFTVTNVEGDGVQDAFYDEEKVFTLSIHEEGRWPFTGALEDRACGSALNLPVPSNFNDNEMDLILDKVVIPIGQKLKPEIIIIQCGADSLADDPLSKL